MTNSADRLPSLSRSPPRLYQVNVWTEKIIPVDIRVQLTDIPQQVVMTKDNVSIIIDSVIYWHV